MGGLITIVKSVARRVIGGAPAVDVKTDQGGGALHTAKLFQVAGTDAPPLPGDYAAELAVPRGNSYVIVGFSDPDNAGTAAPGEHRIYSRNSGGAITSVIYLKANGSIDIVTAGAVKITGDLNVTGDITADGQVSDSVGSMATMRSQYNAHGGHATTPPTPNVPMT